MPDDTGIAAPTATSSAPDPTATGHGNQPHAGLTVVGIGASAGGLEALRALLPKLPANASIAYVIAQHMDPKHRSMLVELLSPSTTMLVSEVRDGERVAASHVYITPPGRNVAISNGRLRLSEPTVAIGPKPSVDFLFFSLAEEVGEQAVGIILSGTGSDGAAGIRAIKAGGGITIVQEASTAKFNGMPHAAVDTGHADVVMPADEIGESLINLIKHPRGILRGGAADESLDDVQKILRMLLAHTGCDFTDYKPSTIDRRIKRRMAVNKLETVREYVRYLVHAPQELDSLLQDILVSVTAFFRDREAFAALEQALSTIVASKHPGETIRIWVPGCASGEETYSIAILLDRMLGNQRDEYRVQIFGTDLDEDAIVRARRGIYPAPSIDEVDRRIRERYFQRVENAFQVVKPIRDMVVFARQNLVKDPPFSRLDLISCRNLLIYFNNRLQKRVLPMFHYVLGSGGYLFLGKSESIGQYAEMFQPVDKRWKVFRRREVAAQGRTALLDSFPARVQPQSAAQRAEREPSLAELIQKAIIETYSPGAVVIDNAFRIRHVQGDVNAYLRLPPGNADLDLLSMARDELRLDLRTLTYRCQRQHEPLRSPPISIQHGDETLTLTLHVRPLRSPDNGPDLLMVMFEKGDRLVGQASAVIASGADQRLRELEQDLSAARKNLQTTVEELETSNEELQSLNQELQSANEELQSSNEELETSNEELQSLNEELTTVNEELQVKSSELAAVNSDLENILDNIGYPLLVVDRELRVVRFTPPASEIFSLTPLDLGQVITSLPCNIALPHLRDDLTEVLDTDRPMEKTLDTGAKVYRLRLRPCYSEHRKTTGVILSFFDRTEVHRREHHLEDSLARLDAILNNVTYAILSVQADGTIASLNRAAEELFGYPADEILGRNVRLLMPERFHRPHDTHMQRLAEGRMQGFPPPTPREVVGRHRDGHELELAITISEGHYRDVRMFTAIFINDAHPDSAQARRTAG